MALSPIYMLDAVIANPYRHTYQSYSRLLRAMAHTDLPQATARIRQLQQGASHPAVVEMPFNSGGAAATWQATAEHFHSFSAVGAVEAYLPAAMGFVAEDAVAVQRILGNLAGGDSTAVTQLDADHMRNLYGFARRMTVANQPPQWVSVTDVVRGTAMFGRIVDTDVARMAAPGTDLPMLVGRMYDVPGLASAAGVYLCRSGKGWGARLEIKTTATRLINNVPAENLRVSLPMPDGHLGPDLAEYVLKNVSIPDVFEIDLWQCKALQDFGAFAANRDTNEIVRQLFSDLSRFGADNWQGAAKGAANAHGNKAALSGRYFPAFDFDHWYVNTKGNPITQVRNVVEAFGGTLDIPVNATTGQVRRLLAEGMHFAMTQKSAQLNQTVEAMKGSAAMTGPIRQNLASVINARIYRRYPRGNAPARLPLDQIDALTLLREGFIHLDEYSTFESLRASNADEFLRLATQRAMGLDPAKVGAMPTINVDMKLVVDGVSQRGVFDPSIAGQL